MQDTSTQVARQAFLEALLGYTVQEALKDPQVTDLMVNPDGTLWIESAQGTMKPHGTIPSHRTYQLLMQLAQLKGVTLTPQQPYIETMLPGYRARLEGTIPPISSAPAFTIRKPAVTIPTLAHYVAKGMMTAQQATVLRTALAAKHNIIVAGGPGSGKTTLVNALLQALYEQCDSAERIVLLEDVAEIHSPFPNTLGLTTTDTVDMTTLLSITLRSHPQRIMVGEVRDGAALALLKAWNTGTPGGLATVHANSASSALLRLAALCEETGAPPPYALIAETVDYVVHMARTPEHPAKRHITAIHRVEDLTANGIISRTLPSL